MRYDIGTCELRYLVQYRRYFLEYDIVVVYYDIVVYLRRISGTISGTISVMTSQMIPGTISVMTSHMISGMIYAWTYGKQVESGSLS